MNAWEGYVEATKRELESEFLNILPKPRVGGIDFGLFPPLDGLVFLGNPFLTKEERYRYGVMVRLTTFWERWFTKPWNPWRKLHKEPIYKYKTVPMLDSVYVCGKTIIGHPATIAAIKETT